MLDKYIDKYAWVARPLLRYGLATVFFYFAISQLINPQGYSFYVPVWVSNFIEPVILVYTNAIFELVFASLLALGLFTRFSALLLALHLALITFQMGFGDTGARDFGLTVATLAVFLSDPDKLCLDNKRKKKS